LADADARFFLCVSVLDRACPEVLSFFHCREAVFDELRVRNVAVFFFFAVHCFVSITATNKQQQKMMPLLLVDELMPRGRSLASRLFVTWTAVSTYV
jgi:hypothetical protein